MALKASEAKALADKTIAYKLECRKQRFGAWVREQAAGRGLGASQICEATQGVVFPRAFVGEQGLPPTLQNAVAQEPRKWEPTGFLGVPGDSWGFLGDSWGGPRGP